MCWVRNNAVALLDFITRNNMTFDELHAFANGVGHTHGLLALGPVQVMRD